MKWYEYILDWITRKAVGLTVFLVFAIIGAGLFFLIIKAVLSAKFKKRETKPKIDCSEIISQAIENYDYVMKNGGDETVDESGEKDKSEIFKRVLKAFLSGMKYSLEKISDVYYDEKVKRYELFKIKGYLPDGIKIPLDFNITELLDFTEQTVNTLQATVENVLNASYIKYPYKLIKGRFFKDCVDKPTENLEDLKFSLVLERLEIANIEKKEKNRIIRWVLGTKPAEYLKEKAVRFFVFRICGKYVKLALVGISDDYNLLCCGFEKKERGYVGQLPTDKGEVATDVLLLPEQSELSELPELPELPDLSDLPETTDLSETDGTTDPTDRIGENFDEDDEEIGDEEFFLGDNSDGEEGAR